MQQPATYEAYVEIATDGSALAQLLDLPGCFGRGATEQEALARLIAAIPGYFAWLQRHDDYTPVVSGPAEVTVRERVAVPPGAFFAPDAEPLDAGDLDVSTALLEWAHADLQAAVRAAAAAGVPPSVEASARLDELLRIQRWLLSRLEEQPMPAQPPNIAAATLSARLEAIARETVTRLRNASDEERARVLEREGERWSLAKVLRRSIVLVRETTAWLES
jgi:predicted RNase H-like HicB family nuclease